jgi:hypothetical protein
MRSLLLTGLIFFTAQICSAQPAEQARKKMSPVLAQLKRPADKNEERIFWISVDNIDSAKHYLQQKNIPVKILSEFSQAGLLVIKTNWRLIDSTIAFSPLVRFIDIPRQPKEELALGAFDNSLNTINLLHHRLPSINGDRLTVSVKENRFNTTDIDFKGRYLPTPLASNEVSPHATIMATILAGAGNSFYTGRGAAWSSTISSSDFASLLPDTGTSYQRFNISVQNHSYGTDIENYYGADAAAYDATVVTQPSLLHIFSAGNAGDRTSAAGTYTGITGLANLTGSFKMAKNILAVGAVDSFGIVAPLSSKGPAYDGRIKPELVAFGQEGSSGAAALTSGIALLIQQAYKQIHGGQLPPAALAKAVLINTADDISTAGPDFSTGYGNVNGFKAVNSILQQQYFSDNISNGATLQYDITIPPAVRKFSLTLCWTDPPAAANAARALVNDLDIEIQNIVTLEKWQPWVLSSFPHRDSLLLAARRSRDSLNNVEKITIDNPMPGIYRISVHGFSVASAQQSWWLTWRSDTAGKFSWHYPTAGDNPEAGRKNIIRWSSTFANTTTGKLEYSLDKGNSWSLLENAIDLQNSFYNFQAPDIFSTILFRMTIDDQEFISDTSAISRALNLSVGFNCPDSVLLYWNSATGINNYQLWRLGEKYLEPFATTTETFIVFSKASGAAQHYTVAPVFNAGRYGIKAHTIDYSEQGVECYIKNFLADLAGTEVLLALELGSLHNVKEIAWEKLNGNRFIHLNTITTIGSLSFQFTDNDLQKGGNTYRAVIILHNGQKIYSRPETVFYFNDSPYLIFPNPVTRNALLQIHSPDLQPRQLIIYDSRGQKLRQQLLTNLVSGVSVSGLSKGVYFILIFKEGKKDYAGHLVVQ